MDYPFAKLKVFEFFFFFFWLGEGGDVEVHRS
jgi:hypothetical protein